MAVALQACRLVKRYGARTAIHELSFTARGGDILGLLGPNGAGKTTAIRMLTTMLQPTSGSFTVAGVDSSRPAEIRHRIGVLPENAGYPQRQTAAEYLRFHARLFGIGRAGAARITDRLLDEVGLGSRADSAIGTFSRGMRQRLGIARALVNDPAVVFLDEPTLGLDPAGQRQVLAILGDIASRRGATVVLSTHLLSEIEQVASRVLILDRGRVVTDDSVSGILRSATGPRRGELAVPPELLERASQAVRSVTGLSAEPTGERPGVLTLTVAGTADQDGRQLNQALAAVLDAGVPVLFFQVDATRLADAFLALTGSAEQ
jgi:ABC-2 type transport system ATP-binding protein